MVPALSVLLKTKYEDEICTSSFSSSTIPLTSGIEEAPQLLLSVSVFVPHQMYRRKGLSSAPVPVTSGNNPTDATVDNLASVCYKNVGLNW
jgi:hypothetical protein